MTPETPTTPATPSPHPYNALGRVAYDAYRHCAGGRSLATGAELPPWRELPAPMRAAWLLAAAAVLDAAGAVPLALAPLMADELHREAHRLREQPPADEPAHSSTSGLPPAAGVLNLNIPIGFALVRVWPTERGGTPTP